MMMTCREVYGFLDDFLEDRLDALTRLKFGGHLVICAVCRSYLATYRVTLAAAHGAELTDAPADTPVPEELIQAILSSRRSDFGSAQTE